jgi:hypothetical protein
MLPQLSPRRLQCYNRIGFHAEIGAGIYLADLISTHAAVGLSLNIRKVHAHLGASRDCARGTSTYSDFHIGVDNEDEDVVIGMSEQEEEEDDDDDGEASAAVTIMLGGNNDLGTICAVDVATPMISGAPLPGITTKVTVSGAPPITASEISATIATTPSTIEAALITTGPTTIPPVMHTTTVSTTKVHTITIFDAQIVSCPADDSGPLSSPRSSICTRTAASLAGYSRYRYPSQYWPSPSIWYLTPRALGTFIPSSILENHMFTSPAGVSSPAVHTTALTQSHHNPTEAVHSRTAAVEEKMLPVVSQASTATATDLIHETGGAETLEGSFAGAALVSMLGLSIPCL